MPERTPVTIGLTWGEAFALLQSLTSYAEAQATYQSPPYGDSPGERIDLHRLTRRVLDACAEAFTHGG